MLKLVYSVMMLSFVGQVYATNSVDDEHQVTNQSSHANYDAFAAEFVSVNDEVKLLELKVKKQKLMDELRVAGDSPVVVNADNNISMVNSELAASDVKLVQVSKLQNSGRIVSFVIDGKIYTMSHGAKFKKYKVYIEPKAVVFWASKDSSFSISF